jgi:hypothetical protein
MTKKNRVLAMRWHPSYWHERHGTDQIMLPKKGRQSADRRNHPLAAPHDQTLPPESARARQRLQREPLASRRSTADSLRRINASAQLQPRFLGNLALFWGTTLPRAKETLCLREKKLPQSLGPGVIGCHPHLPLSQSSELLAGRSSIAAGRCPEPPGNGVTSPVRGHRACPASRPSPVTSLLGRLGRM